MEYYIQAKMEHKDAYDLDRIPFYYSVSLLNLITWIKSLTTFSSAPI